MKKIRLILVPAFLICLLAGVLVTFAQEQVTITTYYPSPFGVYANVSVTNQLKMMGVDTLAPGAPFTGAGIWLAPPTGTTNPIEIASFNSGGARGLRLVYFSTGAAAERNEFGHYVGAAFRGLRITAADQAFFTMDLTVNRDLYVLQNLNVARVLTVQDYLQIGPVGYANTCVQKEYTANSGFTVCPPGFKFLFPISVVPIVPGHFVCCRSCPAPDNNGNGMCDD